MRTEYSVKRVGDRIVLPPTSDEENYRSFIRSDADDALSRFLAISRNRGDSAWCRPACSVLIIPLPPEIDSAGGSIVRRSHNRGLLSAMK